MSNQAAALENEQALEQDGVELAPEDQAAAEGELHQPTPYDELAREMGWKPLSEWRGDKSTWTPADDYIRTTYQKQQEASARIRELKAQNQRVSRAADDYAMRLERLDRTVNTIVSENEERVRRDMRMQFEQAKREALKNEDEERYQKLLDMEEDANRRLDQRREQINQREPDVTKMAEDMLSDPIVGKFWREHRWVAEDENLYNEVFAVAERAAEAGKSAPEQILLVKQYLRSEYPERFQGEQRQRPQPRQGEFEDSQQAQRVHDERGRFVPKNEEHLYQPQRRAPPAYQGAQNGRQALSPEQKALNSLPPEARKVFEEQSKSGRFKGDIVRFAKIYNGEQDNVLD